MKKIVIINGSGGVGKDTFVEMCKGKYTVKNISSVDRIKQAASILGWTGSKYENDRKFLSDLKLLATEFNDSPLTYISDEIEYFMKGTKTSLMFIHVREPLEIQKIESLFDCITLLIKNSNVNGIKSNMADSNVENYKYDYVIDNDGTKEELRIKAYEFLNQIMR